MKMRYVGPSFGIDSLTDGRVYEVTEEDGMYRVIDDKITEAGFDADYELNEIGLKSQQLYSQN